MTLFVLVIELKSQLLRGEVNIDSQNETRDLERATFIKHDDIAHKGYTKVVYETGSLQGTLTTVGT